MLAIFRATVPSLNQDQEEGVKVVLMNGASILLQQTTAEEKLFFAGMESFTRTNNLRKLRMRNQSSFASSIIFLQVVSAFQSQHRGQLCQHQRQGQVGPLCSLSSQGSSSDSDMVFDNNPTSSSHDGTELWLDLRRTAIHPKAAMDHLEAQLGADSFVNRIVLSEDMFQDLIDYSDLYLSSSRILYHDTENDDIFFSTSRGLSFPFGRFHAPPPDAAVVVKDPMEAIEIISAGKWLFLGNQENKYYNDDGLETKRMNAVGNFLDIVVTASRVGAWGSPTETSGLFLPMDGESKELAEERDRSASVGGVAVACATRSSVMKLASTLHLTKSGSITSITKSGIIVQSAKGTSGPVCTAAVLPFEVDLWQTALLVFGPLGIVDNLEH